MPMQRSPKRETNFARFAACHLVVPGDLAHLAELTDHFRASDEEGCGLGLLLPTATHLAEQLVLLLGKELSLLTCER